MHGCQESLWESSERGSEERHFQRHDVGLRLMWDIWDDSDDVEKDAIELQGNHRLSQSNLYPKYTSVLLGVHDLPITRGYITNTLSLPSPVGLGKKLQRWSTFDEKGEDKSLDHNQT